MGKVVQESTVFVHDTTYIDRVRIDSLYVRDSIYVHLAGDTIYQYRDRYVYRDRYLRDTVFKAVHDTTSVVIEREVPVERDLTAWQRFRLRGFWWLLAGFAAATGWIFRKPLKALVRAIILH